MTQQSLISCRPGTDQPRSRAYLGALGFHSGHRVCSKSKRAQHFFHAYPASVCGRSSGGQTRGQPTQSTVKAATQHHGTKTSRSFIARSRTGICGHCGDGVEAWEVDAVKVATHTRRHNRSKGGRRVNNLIGTDCHHFGTRRMAVAAEC